MRRQWGAAGAGSKPPAGVPIQDPRCGAAEGLLLHVEMFIIAHLQKRKLRLTED